MAALIALLALQTAPAMVTLGTYRFDNRDVPATVPALAGPIGADAKVAVIDGKKYLVSAEGKLIRSFRFEGGWSEVRGGFAEAKAAMTATTPEWRVKIVVMPRVDLLDLAPNGLARVRRSTMESAEIAQVADSAARFAAMAEAEAGGKLKVRIEYEVDPDTAFQTVSRGNPPFGTSYLQEYFRPRINGGAYEAEDRVYRGPFDSVFLVHGGFCGPAPLAAVNDAPISPISFYAQGAPQGPFALSIALYNGWAEHLAFAARKSGYRLPEGWPGRIQETPGEYAQGYRGLRAPYPLPMAPAREETPLESYLANAAHVWPPPPADPGPSGSIPAVRLVPNRTEQEVAASLEPNGDTAKDVPVQRTISVKDVQDPERGAALEFRVYGLVRTGEALLLGQRNGPEIFNTASHAYLSFFVKAAHPEPMNLRIVPKGSGPERVIRLFGTWPIPAEHSSDEIESSIWPAEGTWSQVVIDLKKLGLGSVAAVILESNEWVGYWEAFQAQFPQILLDDLRISRSAPGPESAPVSTTASSALAKARLAAEAKPDADAESVQTLIAQLKDSEDLALLNTARAFTRIRSALAEPGLADLVRNIDSRIAEAALEALAFQNSDAGWAAIKRAVEIGPFDYTRCFAARALGGKKDTKNVGTLSLMLTARNWRGRQWAAESIGTMANGPQQMVLMAFLHEIDPAVRLAATRAANPANDEVCRRFLWSAVNDPSDEVRAWSCFGLVKSGIARFASEGMKGVRDDSIGMRKRFLQLIGEAKDEAFRPAVRLAAVDASPTVRAEALRTFAALPGPVTAAELGNAATDKDPRVQAALETLKRAKAIG